MVRTLFRAAVAAAALTYATFGHASIGCVDATFRPKAGQPEQPMPAGFDACASGAVIAHDNTNVWRCQVKPGFEDKVNATYLIVVEKDGRIVAQERDDMIGGPLDAMRWYEVDFDRDGKREHVIATRVIETPAHAIQNWRVRIFSADWASVIASFEGMEDFGPDALFRVSEDQPCLLLQTVYDAVDAETEQLKLKGELWTVADGELATLDGAPDDRLLDTAFIAERRQGMVPGEIERTPYRWLYRRDHDRTGSVQ